MERFLLFFSLLISVCVCHASFPPNFPFNEAGIDYYEIGPHEDRGSEVSEEDFYSIINRVHSLYRAEAETLDRILNTGIVDWQQSYFSAWAHNPEDNIYTINFWGGFARLPGMTKRGFILTVCHEIGHVLGGQPYHTIEAHKNMTSEGQSDYFAAAVCFKKYNRTFKLDKVESSDPYVVHRCRRKFSNVLDFEECLQVAKAGESLGAVLALLGGVLNPDYSTPSSHYVEHTLFDSYPKVQCRLDTFMSGALSTYTNDTHLVSSDEFLRPPCWFKK